MNTLTTEQQSTREEYIQNTLFQKAMERFSDYEEYMEIPGYEPEETSNDIERIGSFDEYMENLGFTNNVEPYIIPEVLEYQTILEKRFQVSVKRYEGIEEYMEIPNMNLWIDLKKEIQENNMSLVGDDYSIYSIDSLDRNESREACFVDKMTCGRSDSD